MARSFAGANTDSVVVSGWSGATYNPTDVTLSVWVYPTALIASDNIFNGNVGASFLCRLNADGSIEIDRKAFTVCRIGTATITANAWWNIVIVYTKGSPGGPITSYINGSLDPYTSGGLNCNFADPTAGIIGNNFAGASESFKGRIADLALWNVLFTTGEISSLASGERPYNIRPKSLLAYWPLDGLSSPEPDLSGSSLNGTVTGTALANGPPTTFFTPKSPSRFNLPAIAAQIFSFDQMSAHITRKITNVDY